MTDSQNDLRQYAPATERNRQPILEVLKQVLPQEAVSNAGTVLEISSGTGEHATYFASNLSHLYWLPSEPQASGRASIQAWGKAMPADNLLLPPLALDVSRQPWPVESSTVQSRLNELGAPICAIVNINMIHIAPWEMCEHLMAGAARILLKGGVLYLYGPYKQGGQQTAPSNEAFDQMLRSRDPSWGIRDLEAVVETAEQCGLSLSNVIEMPANNFSVIFTRA
ncbi:MAG: DUF938 domain-containing protein [Cyanobacteria bacterium P01_D01_bin.105]